MKTLHIHTTIDATGSVLSLGSYWDCNGRQPQETPWEYIGDERGLTLALGILRDDSEAEFMHILNRAISAQQKVTEYQRVSGFDV